MKFYKVGLRALSMVSALALVLALNFVVYVPGVEAQQGSNRYAFISPGNCFGTATTTAFDTQALKRAAAGNLVLDMNADTTGGTITVTCDVTPPVGPLGNANMLIRDVSLLYGQQTTAMTSIAAATVNTVSYPNSTAAGAAAAGTVVTTAGGTLTVTPTALQLTTTTTGQCFNERLLFGTPLQLADRQRLTIEQVFTKAAADTTLQICGAIVHYSQPPGN